MAKKKSTDQHRQCKLRKGDILTYSWIPAKYAVVGKALGLCDEDGVWSEGWAVEEVWASRPSTDVVAQSEFYRKHRDGTDAVRDSGKDDEPGTWIGPRR